MSFGSASPSAKDAAPQRRDLSRQSAKRDGGSDAKAGLSVDERAPAPQALYANPSTFSLSASRSDCDPSQGHRAHSAYFEESALGIGVACPSHMAENKRFVYVLRSTDTDPHFYIGLTSDAPDRLADHNAGRCPHTARHRPWQLHVVIEFNDEPTAIRFERYLKSGSGRAFAKRHFHP